MKIPYTSIFILPLAMFIISGCGPAKEKQQKTETTLETGKESTFTPLDGKVRLMNVAPGHFHAGLVQKSMYESVDPVVWVYAPEGPEVKDYLARIDQYNSREEDPTSWEEKVYTGEDFFERMLEEKPGNVMVVSGNNASKTSYILEAVKAGIHVLADKPMVVDPGEFPMLEEAFALAGENGVLLYDIMTERYEATTMAQKLLSMDGEIFGTLEKGSPEQPSITKESVHHFSKIVSGKHLIRPPWFFDTRQQGEGMVDVATHLVDLVQWEAFPEVTLAKEDVEIISARHWTTDLSADMFEKVTGLTEFPAYLQKDVEEGLLKVYSNGEINYRLKGVHAKVSVIWNFEAPEGTGDTHYSIMRGSKARLVIRQGEAEGYKPILYIELNDGTDREAYSEMLPGLFDKRMSPAFPGISLEALEPGRWVVNIPEKYKVGHEAHFGQVTEKYLDYLEAGRLPGWEIPNMIVKYHTTTEGLKKAMR